MSNIEFVSGFGIGHVIFTSIHRGDDPNRIRKFLKISYSFVWETFLLHPDFLRGLKKGLQDNNPPLLSPQIDLWFDKYFIIGLFNPLDVEV